jgi:hypothetical protein
MKIHNNKNPPGGDHLLIQETNFHNKLLCCPCPFQKNQGRGWPKKVSAVHDVEIPGNKAQHQEEAPPAPAKKQHLKVNWSSDYNWPALC